MRTAIVLVAALAACNWTEFDDLEHDAWAVSIKKPNVKSSDYGVAIQRGARAGTGGTLVVIGAGQATFSELVFDAAGASKLSANTLELNAQYGIGTLDPQPIVLAAPSSDDVSLVLNSGANSIAVLTGAGQINLHQVFTNPSPVDAATYMKPPNRIDAGHIGEPQPEEPLIASGEFVLGTFYSNPPNPQPRCKLTDGGVSINPRALGVVNAGVSDDVLAWGASGKLYRYPGTVFLGCATVQEPLAQLDVGFAPGKGSQIIAIPGLAGPLVLLQGHHDGDETSILQVHNAATLAKVGGPVSLPRLKSAAILEVGSTPYAIAGYPSNVAGGKVAGQVLLFPLSASGIASAPALTLNDAQPESNESFGRAVAAMPFNGKPVIAVAADNEIFVYFRANLTSGAPLYGETREGR